ncbi:Chitin synthase, class 3 [Cryptotrichosporon argae]
MSRPTYQQNVSFSDDARPPRPPAKELLSKSSFGTYDQSVPAVDYEDGYLDPAIDNPQGFSASNGADVRRKKSMVRPERERIDPGHRLYHYREHAAGDNLPVQPSRTGNQPHQRPGANLRRGKSLLARDTEQQADESGLNLFKRGATIRRKASRAAPRPPNSINSNRVNLPGSDEVKSGCCANIAPGPVDGWMIYCFIITCWIPGFVISKLFGKKTPEAQRAWREKMGVVAISASGMAAVGFITFGFTDTVCSSTSIRIKGGQVNNGSVIINGYDYDFSTWKHPAVSGSSEFNGSTSPIYDDAWMAGGTDISFLFQNVNKNCYGLITPANGTGIAYSGDSLGWYFPCNLHDQNGTSAVNKTGYTSATNCHTNSTARSDLAAITATAEVYYTWDQVKDTSRNLAVFKSSVLDLSLLQWLDTSQVSYPSFFDTVKTANTTYQGKDITAIMQRSGMHNIGECLADVVTVGFIDSITIGCVASDIVLYVSLVFILGVVLIRFFMALIFGWFLSWRMGNFEGESYSQRMKRAAEIENWTDDIYRAAPGYLRPNANNGRAGGGGGGGQRKTMFLPTTSRFSRAEPMLVQQGRPTTAYGSTSFDTPRRQTSSMYGTNLAPGLRQTPPGSPLIRGSRSSTSLPFRDEHQSLYGQSSDSGHGGAIAGACPWPLNNVVPQPGPDFEPYGYPLVHTLCLVTAYSESIEGLRTTLDSIATTDYPNSHKLILVICDGMVKGENCSKFTPDIVLDMMQEFVVPPEEVEPHSYVAIADGHKRHNMAKVYAGFYSYDDNTVEKNKQQRVPIVLVAKTGNPLEANERKPGNRGKRDSQIVLMAFLQKVMFDERMTTFEYEFFNAIWRATGVSPDKFETCLCVDADTKVFPDSLTRMNACMVNDHEIMGLCGETKIANKTETWVTMIQVFEYYISHHQTKAFESVFGGVTCLPGCFSMYRIKAPKGDRGYWVPVLANPDIVEHYSENVVDTLHKKNLLLLGEDRYLSTLMLKTFPKRKMVFCPQAVCKTIVPDRFRILLSQRRRWINSTIHNLFELMLVRDLCGTFCFSMQFIVFMDLAGTLVLPAAISFTLYIIIISIIPQSVTGTPTPTISLILLAAILGLPGILIVITSRKLVYVGWMLLYLFSLPVWNFVLPAYSFWHMDDFSWGETRKIVGEGKESNHGDKEGTFDSSNIVMKRWVEFERERRWRAGDIGARDSYGDILHRSGSPKNGNRYSMVSTSETYTSGGYNNEGNPFFRQSQSFASMPNTSEPSSTEHSSISGLQLAPPRGSTNMTRDPSPTSTVESGSPGMGRLERNASDEQTLQYSAYPESYPDEDQPILPPQFSSASGSASGGYRYEDTPAAYQPQRASRQPSHGRGVSLVDTGPVQVSHDPVRRTSKQHARRTSTGRGQVLSPTSSNSHASSLPPGAAPARF